MKIQFLLNNDPAALVVSKYNLESGKFDPIKAFFITEWFNNYNLEHLDLYSNSLSVLDMRNGNNQNISYFVTWNCWNSQFLECISVDDSTYSTNNWTSIDTWHYFSNNCNPLAIEEHSSKKELLKITDLLGREIKGAKNQLLFYIYDDGTVEKKLIIE